MRSATPGARRSSGSTSANSASAISTQSATGSNPYAAAWFSYYDDPRFDNVDLTLPTSQTILAGLVSTALMTQAQSNNITAMSSATIPKYGPVLWGDVTLARQSLGLE